MKINNIFHQPTKQQIDVFNAVSHIIERYFPKASAYTDTYDNQIWFNCGYDEIVAINKSIYHEPDENTLENLCKYLNNLSQKQESKIQFKIICYDYGIAVPSGIQAIW